MAEVRARHRRSSQPYGDVKELLTERDVVVGHLTRYSGEYNGPLRTAVRRLQLVPDGGVMVLAADLGGRGGRSVSEMLLISVIHRD